MILYGSLRTKRDALLDEAPGKFTFSSNVPCNSNSLTHRTVDIWTAPNGVPFLGIVVHWITVDWQIRSMVYDFIPFRGSHTGARIFETFDESIAPVRGRVFGIAVDNATNNDAFIRECIDKYDYFLR